MDQEESELAGEGMAVLFGLPGSRLDRDDDIAQEMRLRRWGTSLLRKGEDVGGTIVVQIRSIEPPDGPIIDEEHRELIPRSAQGGQCPLAHPF